MKNKLESKKLAMNLRSKLFQKFISIEFEKYSYFSFQAVESFEQKFSCGLPWMKNKTLCSLEQITNLSSVILNYTCIAHYGCENCNLSQYAIKG